nr:uncharacterized protein LOC104097303 [Nicotiana tomentosiformis]
MSSSFRFKRERDTARNNNSNSQSRIGNYNFNVSTSELVAILKGMGDKGNVHAARKTSKVTITNGKRVRHVLEGHIIVFDDEDTNDLIISHNDALVISLLVHDTNVKRVLIDPGRSANIILLRVVNEMQMNDQIILKARSLSGFDNSSVVAKGEIILATFVEGVIKDTKFQAVDADMAYNIILGSPWIHDMDAVASTLHWVIKFPSQWRIRQIRGDQ